MPEPKFTPEHHGTPVLEELANERAFLRWLYELVDADREYLMGLQREVLTRAAATGPEQLDRDTMAANIAGRLARLDSVATSLCFGKLVEAGSREEFHIGRIAVADGDGQPALVDWRAPIAEAFYRATAANPMGMLLRRHLLTVGRRLDGIEDELLDSSAIDDEGARTLVGEAALLHALRRERTGRMGDIVATIQRDQDEIIRAPLKSTMLVTGGPGTGKTVVALHRAAYLLYAHQATVAAQGVLVVGPSDLFLRYIERVLPSLGETAVVLTSWSRLLPDMHADDEADPAVADLKGRIVMAEVMRRAVALFERAPRAGVVVLDAAGQERRLPQATLDSIRRRVRALGLPHNEARRRHRHLLARTVGVDRLDDEHPRAGRIEAAIDRAVDRLWPELSPSQVLQAVFATTRLLDIAGDGMLTADERNLLIRATDQPFTTSDLPLLDELRVLLGEREVRRRGPTEEETTIREMAEVTLNEIAEVLDEASSAGDLVRAMLTPEALVARHHGEPRRLTLADMARVDPSWRYAHVVVDEAQDATPMQWRMLLRRTTGGSMTIVGDPDQASRPARDSLTDRILAGAPKAAIDHHTLDVNYRTPAEIVEPARRLREARTGVSGPATTRYVRTGIAPWTQQAKVLDGVLARSAVERALRELGQVGRLAVICPQRHLELARSEVAALTADEAPRGGARLDTQVAVYLPTEVKGLEFDAVVVIDPSLIEADHGWRLLYVTLTRSTRNLGLLLVGSQRPDWIG